MSLACPGVAPLTTSIRPLAPEARPPTVKTTPATWLQDSTVPPHLQPHLLQLQVLPDRLDFRAQLHGRGWVDLANKVNIRFCQTRSPFTSMATSTFFICWELRTFLVMAAAPPASPLASPREAPWGQKSAPTSMTRLNPPPRARAGRRQPWGQSWPLQRGWGPRRAHRPQSPQSEEGTGRPVAWRTIAHLGHTGLVSYGVHVVGDLTQAADSVLSHLRKTHVFDRLSGAAKLKLRWIISFISTF